MLSRDPSLNKIRGYSYIIFFLYVLMLFKEVLTKILPFTGQKLLFGFILLAFIQLTVCILYGMKFAMGIKRKNKNYKIITMLATRLRFYCTMQYIGLILLIINDTFLQSYILEKVLVVYLIIMLFYVLINCTKLQKNEF